MPFVLLGCQQETPSPAELAHKALQSDDPAEQERAAVDLAQLGSNKELDPQIRDEAKQQLRHLLDKTQSPLVRKACIHGLGSLWDYESMPAMLDALDDESEAVRSAASVTVERMMSVTLAGFGYKFSDPAQKRAPAVKRIRADWETKRDSPVFIKWRERLKAKAESS
jgi:hypothetical protein